MRYTAKNLADFGQKLIVYSRGNDINEQPLVLYHYTTDYSKSKIVDEEKGTVDFRLTRVSDFTDKNECIYIIEPYVHAYGYLYNANVIDKEFYLLLRDIKPKDIYSEDSNLWVACFTAEGNSQFLKEKYAPGDGWIIELMYFPFEDLQIEFALTKNDTYPNYILLSEVEYSYAKMKRRIEKMLSHLYYCFKNDNAPKREKKKLVKKIVVDYLSMFNLSYKSSSYKEEKEIRLICNISKDVTTWKSNEDSQAKLEFRGNGKKESLYLTFKRNCYRASFHDIDIYRSVEMNKPVITRQNTIDTLKKRSK